MIRPRHLLVVEDDPELAQLTRLHLEDEGFRVRVVGDGRIALGVARGEDFDLILLDLNLPGLDGLDLCRALRRRSTTVPILVVTARGSESDRILGLEIGADDYLSKPLSLLELSARVRAMFRRVDALAEQEEPDATLVRGDLEIDRARRLARVRGNPIELTAKEFDLLNHFASRPGRVYTRGELVDCVWGPGYAGYEHTVNSHINRLRAKINGNGPRQQFIETVWGVGYRFHESL